WSVTGVQTWALPTSTLISRSRTSYICRVTLRGRRMYEFLDRLINVALPRIRDFRGINPKSFDGNGNYTMGLTEQLVFPEIDPDKIGRASCREKSRAR